MSRKLLDVNALYCALDTARSQDGLSWRGLAKVVGVGPSTFTRMVGGGCPSADALCALLSWLGAPIDSFAVDAPGDAS